MMINEPLAFRMRPANIDEVVGQRHIIGEGTATYNMIKNGKVPSMLLYGDPGIGKTSIASAISGTINVPFRLINATTAGKKDIEEAVKAAEKEGFMVLAIDEVHRFNKVQQDALLPHVEKGLITLIGMTTENPYHSVLPAVRSRCGLIKQLKRLTSEDIVSLLNRALKDEERGLGKEKIIISNELLEKIAVATNGEVRSALTTLEMAFFASKKNENGENEITEDILSEILEGKGFNHDKGGDIFYNLLSALQNYIYEIKKRKKEKTVILMIYSSFFLEKNMS